MLRSHIALLLVFAATICGCSGRVATYPVSGTVRFDDRQPVRVGIVEFRCRETGVTARGKLDGAGSFKLGTFAVADGAPAGDYRIVVVQYFDAQPPKQGHKHVDLDNHEPSDHDALRHGQEPDARVARKFSDYSTSTLAATVRPGDENRFDFVVSRPVQPRRQVRPK